MFTIPKSIQFCNTLQFRKILFLLFFSLVILGQSSNLLSQELRVNEKGEQIIVFPDGSWQYFHTFDKSEEDKEGEQKESQVPQTTTEKRYPIFEASISPLAGSISISEEDLLKISIRRSQIASEASEIAKIFG